MHTWSRRQLLAAAASSTTVGALAACSPADPIAGPSATAGATGPVSLVYWSWAPQIESIIQLFNDTHPDIQVTVSTAAGVGEFQSKLLAAYKAGNPPDVNNTGYANLPALITSGVVADISDVMAPLKDEFSPVAWDMVTFDGATYGVPQSTTPNLLLYRKDLFAQLGLTAPATWQEYAEAARAVRAADPTLYLGNWDFAAGLRDWIPLAQQNGVENWSLEDGEWGVGIASPAAKEVAEFWGGLVEEGAVSTLKAGSPELNAAVADGKILSVVDSVWGPVTLSGYAAGTKGSWGVAVAPQWDEDDPVSGVLGGSATVVSSVTEHPAEARVLAEWLNYSEEALAAYIKKVSIFPARLSAREFPELKAAPEFMPDVPEFYQVAAEIDRYARPAVFGPNAAQASADFGTAFAGAVQSGASPAAFSAALDSVQETVVADMEDEGYTVSTTS